MTGELSVADLPEAWNARMREYLGIEVPSDAEGVLQDVHWSAGLIGYFPTYALGNMIAGQLWERVHAEMPDLEDQIAAGELGGLRDWLGENDSPSWLPVHDRGAARPRRRWTDRGRAVRRLPEEQARRRVRRRLGVT